MMEELCEARLKKQGRLSIEKLVLVCGRLSSNFKVRAKRWHACG